MGFDSCEWVCACAFVRDCAFACMCVFNYLLLMKVCCSFQHLAHNSARVVLSKQRTVLLLTFELIQQLTTLQQLRYNISAVCACEKC